jgi:hypothetical protein
MALIIDYMPYVIFFHNRDEYTYALATAGGSSSGGANYDGCPVRAANAFGIPYPFPSGDMDNISKGIYYMNYVPGKELNNFAPPSIILQDNIDWFDVPGYPGSAGFAAAGVGRRLAWSGAIIYMKGDAPVDPLLPTTIPQRRWIGGWEVPGKGEGASVMSVAIGCRDSSRTIDGLGFAVRGINAITCVRRVNEFQAGYTTNRSWERIYFRVRRFGLTNFMFWNCKGNVFPSAGSGLRITTTGFLQLIDIDAISTITVIGTDTIPTVLNKWYRADIFLKYDSSGGANHGSIIVYINGILKFSSVSLNMDANSLHLETNVGLTVGGDTQIEMDFDDWINSEWPLNAGLLSFDSMDFLMGSHIRRVLNTGGTAANYTLANAWMITNQGFNPDQQLSASLQSTTASALIAVTNGLPALGVQDKFGEVTVGAVAGVISTITINAGGTDGQLGYSLAGGANVMATIDEQATSNWRSVAFRPTGLIQPVEINPLVIRYTKSADANLATVEALQALVEYIGVWGQEDVSDPNLFPTDLPRTNWLHNCRYPNTPYGFMGPTLDSRVYVVGGTYVGNGTQQEITLPDACHMLIIRPLTGSANGIKFFGASTGGHFGITERVFPNLVQVYFDSVSGTFKFQVIGTSVESNANGNTFQYTAICDPGMRYCVAGTYNTGVVVSSRANLLQNDSFLPEFAFVQLDTLGATSNTLGLWYKGPGNVGNAGNQADGASLVPNFGSFGTGVLNTAVGLHANTLGQFNYLCFRSVEPGCGWIMAQIMSYVGDGTGSRVINLTPVSGRAPIFALVIPASTANPAFFRDGSHVGANSCQFANLNNSITAITAGGIDTITVGVTLNVNLTVYNVFVLPGSLTAWQNGTYYPPNCDSPDAFYTPVMDPPELATLGNGGLTLDGSTTITMLKNISGIYTLVPDKTNDTMYDRQSGQASVDIKIPNPTAKTGYIGG